LKGLSIFWKDFYRSAEMQLRCNLPHDEVILLGKKGRKQLKKKKTVKKEARPPKKKQ
jgi:hypothetical protein